MTYDKITVWCLSFHFIVICFYHNGICCCLYVLKFSFLQTRLYQHLVKMGVMNFLCMHQWRMFTSLQAGKRLLSYSWMHTSYPFFSFFIPLWCIPHNSVHSVTLYKQIGSIPLQYTTFSKINWCALMKWRCWVAVEATRCLQQSTWLSF